MIKPDIDIVCPLCNGLVLADMHCDKCDSSLDEIGRMEEYVDPYAANIDVTAFTSSFDSNVMSGDDSCVHLFYCKECNKYKTKSFRYVKI